MDVERFNLRFVPLLLLDETEHVDSVGEGEGSDLVAFSPFCETVSLAFVRDLDKSAAAIMVLDR